MAKVEVPKIPKDKKKEHLYMYFFLIIFRGLLAQTGSMSPLSTPWEASGPQVGG